MLDNTSFNNFKNKNIFDSEITNIGVDCGGYHAKACYDCIIYRYLDRYLHYLWCNGECVWDWTHFTCEEGKFTFSGAIKLKTIRGIIICDVTILTNIYITTL